MFALNEDTPVDTWKLKRECRILTSGGRVVDASDVVLCQTPLPAAVAPQWVTLGVVLGTGVGIFAGVYPASQASKMNPVDALRYE